MNRSRVLPHRPIWLVALLNLCVFFFFSGTNRAAAQEFVLNWNALGFVNGTSSQQVFLDIDGSGVNMTVEFWVLDENFNELGLYVPGTLPGNQNMPEVGTGSLGVRDISASAFPDAGYIQTRITFSQDITINDLWMEPFYHWEDQDVLKHAALQAFDEDGNGLVPLTWTTYGGSDMVVTVHPANNEPWWRSDFPPSQITYSGSGDINFGTQAIRELHWYSWGLDPIDGTTLQNVLGSTYIGEFTFSVAPTAVSLQSFAPVTSALPTIGLLGFLALAVVSLGVVIVRRERK
jgi:hypothetical protein